MAVEKPKPKPKPDDDPTEERSEGPTPNGGAYAIAYFSDGSGNRVPKSQATAMEIVEYDQDGEQIHRTYMTREKPAR